MMNPTGHSLPSGPRLTDGTLFGSFPEPDRHTAALANPSEFLPHRDFRSMAIIFFTYDQKWDRQNRCVNCDGIH